ncbi:hypothetical protein DRQ36_07115 [bacterium]|nr:MAG: hypothetical protein DRQ36_07115 [bacterium]
MGKVAGFRTDWFASSDKYESLINNIMRKKKKTTIKDIFLAIFEWFFGKEPSEQKYSLVVYIIATVVFVFMTPLIFTLGAVWGNLTCGKMIFFPVFFYIIVIIIVRVMIHIGRGAESIYQGSETGDSGGDDFSEIESLVALARFDEAIERYKQEYEEREGKDERPRIRIGEIYWFEMKDYVAALNQFALIARTTDDKGIQLNMYTRILELFRDHLPDHPGYDKFCRYVLSEFPDTLAARMAADHISNSGG